MFKHIKVISVLSLILFLAGIFLIIFSINEVNTITVENGKHYETSVESTNIKKIIIGGSVPMRYEYDYGGEFSVSIDNINPDHVKIREDGDELYINYEIKSKSMDRLFLPLISYATDTRPVIKIIIPEEFSVAECNDDSSGNYFNFDLIKLIDSRYYPDTKVELVLENNSAQEIATYVVETYEIDNK